MTLLHKFMHAAIRNSALYIISLCGKVEAGNQGAVIYLNYSSLLEHHASSRFVMALSKQRPVVQMSIRPSSLDLTETSHGRVTSDGQ